MYGTCLRCKELCDKHTPNNLCTRCHNEYNRVVLNIKKLTLAPSFWDRFRKFREKYKENSRLDNEYLKCEKCDKVFRNRSILNRHYKLEHTPASKLDRPKRKKVNPDESAATSSLSSEGCLEFHPSILLNHSRNLRLWNNKKILTEIW